MPAHYRRGGILCNLCRATINASNGYWRCNSLCNFDLCNKCKESSVSPIARNKKNGKQADIWALGMLLIEMATLTEKPKE